MICVASESAEAIAQSKRIEKWDCNFSEGNIKLHDYMTKLSFHTFSRHIFRNSVMSLFLLWVI